MSLANEERANLNSLQRNRPVNDAPVKVDPPVLPTIEEVRDDKFTKPKP